MYQDHLILPLPFLFYHSVIASLFPNAFAEPSEEIHVPPSPSDLPPTLQGELEGL